MTNAMQRQSGFLQLELTLVNSKHTCTVAAVENSDTLTTPNF
jgi:hypothetical protein